MLYNVCFSLAVLVADQRKRKNPVANIEILAANV